MQNRQIQFKICYFCTLFQVFVFNRDPGARTPHIENDFFLQIRGPNKYIGKVNKRRFIKYNGFGVRYRNVLGGADSAPPAWNRVKIHTAFVTAGVDIAIPLFLSCSKVRFDTICWFPLLSRIRF